MRYLFVIMRYLISESYECRLMMLCFIVVLIKLLRSLNSKDLDEYISTQYASVIWVF